MASSTALKGLADFFICSVCLDQLKEPKLLPCLHRYCSDCLNTVIQAGNDVALKCPMCKQDCIIPPNGVDGFKTDFHMKSILEFIQFKKSFEMIELKKCISCLQTKIASAYCFKCKHFLCEQCYQFHLNSPMFTDHQSRILNLENIEAQNLTLDKLAALTDDPVCHIHVKQQAQLCCSTCENAPICVICTYSKHKGHDVRDVTELAKSERERLTMKFAELNKHKRKLYELPKKIETITQKLNENVAKKTENLINQQKEQAFKINDKLAERTTIRGRGLTDIDKRRKDENIQINVKQEEELLQVRQKYIEITAIMEEKYDKESEKFNVKCDEIDGELFIKLGSLDDNLKNLTTTTELLKEQNENDLKDISDYCKQVIKRYENFTATTSSILAVKDEWTDARCIPDIRAASEPLIEEMKKEFPELESLSDIIISDITKVIDDDVTITEHEESVIAVDGIIVEGWVINGIRSSRDGNIVITGSVSDECSHITVFNRKGELQRQDQIMREKKYHRRLQRYCCSFTMFKVLTVCFPDEIGIYDIRDGSYKKKNISDVINSWPQDQRVWCVTTDYVNNHIIVGTSSRDIHVFDDQLNHNHTITLPDVINGSHNITVHRGSLLICVYNCEMAYSVSMEGSESKVMFEFTKPDLDGGYWAPRSVCTDKTGFIYMLWDAQFSSEWRSILVQYSPDGRQLLMTKSVDGYAIEMTTFEADHKEKLLIVTNSGKLYTYGLVLR